MHCFSLRHRGHKLSFGPLPIWTADDCRCATLHYSAISWSSTSRSRASSRIHRFFLLVTNFLLIFRQATQEFFVIDSVLSLTFLSLGEVMWISNTVCEKIQLFALFKQQLGWTKYNFRSKLVKRLLTSFLGFSCVAYKTYWVCTKKSVIRSHDFVLLMYKKKAMCLILTLSFVCFLLIRKKMGPCY